LLLASRCPLQPHPRKRGRRVRFHRSRALRLRLRARGANKNKKNMLLQNIKIAVDAIVFGYINNSLQLLLIQQKFGQMKQKWALVGGFVKDEETLDEAARRELQEETGLQINYLEQLYTFGEVARDPRFRVVSVAYLALVNAHDLHPKADTDAEKAEWFDIKNLPPLAFDHSHIFQVALKRIQNKLRYQPIGFDLLPESFLFSDLENLYCTILEKEIDRRNFRKKILSFGLVEETNLFAAKKTGRPARLFRFNKQKYKQLEEEGFLFEIS
jgi:8-oxo-dGTP diphosphatase